MFKPAERGEKISDRSRLRTAVIIIFSWGDILGSGHLEDQEGNGVVLYSLLWRLRDGLISLQFRSSGRFACWWCWYLPSVCRRCVNLSSNWQLGLNERVKDEAVTCVLGNSACWKRLSSLSCLSVPTYHSQFHRAFLPHHPPPPRSKFRFWILLKFINTYRSWLIWDKENQTLSTQSALSLSSLSMIGLYNWNRLCSLWSTYWGWRNICAASIHHDRLGMSNIEFLSDIVYRESLVRKLGRFEQQIRNTWKVLKCGAGEGWRRSVGPIMFNICTIN